MKRTKRALVCFGMAVAIIATITVGVFASEIEDPYGRKLSIKPVITVTQDVNDGILD